MTPLARIYSGLGPNPVAETFLACLDRARHGTKPYIYWLLKDALPAEDVDAILTLSAAPPEGIVLNGKRETNNALRGLFSRENQERFPVCRHVAEASSIPASKRQSRRRPVRISRTLIQ